MRAQSLRVAVCLLVMLGLPAALGLLGPAASEPARAASRAVSLLCTL
jgi:hypothetical protein